ncbi:DUF790 family protein [Halovenus rubra]|uniref:DUF790 family protein n=2 Tax=Halovenus rubra TaxID=869890 RepID=A0ACC7E046_9EURY|nr:DUF790 family protein [Halovenus rubra]
MLTKELLRVSRHGGGYRPQFADESHEQIAARVIGCYQGHVGEQRETLRETLSTIERESDDFKLVRGFAKLLDREATWEVQSPIDPERAREAAFAASEAVGVVTEAERMAALDRVAQQLDATPESVEGSLYADLESREVLAEVDSRWSPAELVEQYNLSLAQTALFDATEVRIRSSDPKTVVSALKRLRLLYEIRRLPESERRSVADNDREIVVTGPDALFKKTRRYGTRFARLLRTVAKTTEWRLEATVDDRGTERNLVLTDGDVTVPGVDPVTEVTYDSGIEAEFARRFESLDLDWTLVREPDAVAAGEHVVIPDFALDYDFGDFRVYFEIMGFWTPDYVEKKLTRLEEVMDVELLVAVDESLGVGEEIEDRDHRAIPYSGSVRIKDVRNALRRYEEQLQADAAQTLPDVLHPEADVVTLAALSDEYGVSKQAIEDMAFPDHERVGGTLLRPAVLDTISEEITPGLSLAAVEGVLEEYGCSETSAVLGHLGYGVEWEGLSGGTVRER